MHEIEGSLGARIDVQEQEPSNRTNSLPLGKTTCSKLLQVE